MAQAISREMESTLGLKIPFLDFLTGSEWARRAGEPGICDFVTGDPKEPPPPGYCEALQRWSVPQRPDWYGYKMNEREACRVVAASLQARYGVGFRPEQVSMTNGSLAALTVAMRALVDPGGEVAFFSPPWSGYEPMIIVRGAVPVRVKLQPPDFDYYKYMRFGDIIGVLYPTGELNVAPVEYSANGKLVIDLTMHALGRLRDPIELNIKDGRVVSIEGGAEAHALRTYLAAYGDENAYLCPAEASVGRNRRALIRGVQREDKNIFGAMHFGLGTNIDVGGTIHSSIHMDGVILQPTLYVDGEMRIKDGEFLVPLGL